MTWLATIVALMTVNAAPEPVAPVVAHTPARLACPEGAKLIGDPPPEGKKRWCSYRGQDGLQVFHGHYWEWHDNGQLALEGDFVHGIRNGRWAEYDRAGGLTIESNYRAGNLEGAYVGIIDGQRLEGSYKAGQRDGTWRYFGTNGKKAGEGPYKDGVRNGRWTVWFDDGSRAEGSYVADVRQGRWTIYGPNGARRAEGPVVDGQRKGAWTEYDERGALLAKGPYVDDMREGKWVIYYSHGGKQAHGSYTADSRTGLWVESDSDGRRWQGRYDNGTKQGPWECTYANGKVAEQGLMRDGKRNGEWTFFNDKGVLSARGVFRDDERIGIWTETTRDGGYIEGEYRNNERDGVWATFAVDGSARGEIRFSGGLRVDMQSPTGNP